MSENEVITFPTPCTAEKSEIYTVTAGGEDVFVERFEDVHYAQFAFSRRCEVTVSVKPTVGHANLKFIHSYSISPKRYGVAAKVELNHVTFTLKEPRKLVIQINEYQRLVIFAEEIEKDAPKPGDGGVVNVLDFVSDNEGRQLQTGNIAAAVKATPAGGTLYFPPGVYVTGTISLKSEMTLYLAGGALVKGSTDGADYPVNEKFWHWANQSLVEATGAQNVRIAGYGTLDGSGTVLRARQEGGHILVAGDCKDFTIENVITRDPATQNTHPVNVEGFTARNVKVIDNRDVLNADGIDLSSVRGGLVEDCFTYAADDAIVVKSYGRYESRDILARRNVVLTKKSALKVGTETEADITNVTFIDNEVIESDRGMSVYVEDGSTIRNVEYLNNRFEYPWPDARQRLVDIYVWNRANGGGRIENVLIKDCEADVRWPRPSTIIGYDEKNSVSGVHFENFRLAGKLCETLREADLLIDVLPFWDVRRPHVHDVEIGASEDRQ
jgi:hypothetical protein